MCDFPRLEAPQSVPGPPLVKGGGWERVRMSGPHLILPFPVTAQILSLRFPSVLGGPHLSQHRDTVAILTMAKILTPHLPQGMLTLTTVAPHLQQQCSH